MAITRAQSPFFGGNRSPVDVSRIPLPRSSSVSPVSGSRIPRIAPSASSSSRVWSSSRGSISRRLEAARRDALSVATTSIWRSRSTRSVMSFERQVTYSTRPRPSSIGLAMVRLCRTSPEAVSTRVSLSPLTPVSNTWRISASPFSASWGGRMAWGIFPMMSSGAFPRGRAKASLTYR